MNSYSMAVNWGIPHATVDFIQKSKSWVCQKVNRIKACSEIPHNFTLQPTIDPIGQW